MHHSLVRASKVFTVTIPRFTVTIQRFTSTIPWFTVTIIFTQSQFTLTIPKFTVTIPKFVHAHSNKAPICFTVTKGDPFPLEPARAT